MLDATLSALDAQFSATERLTPEEFEALPLREKLDWHDVSHPSDVSVPLAMDTFNPAPVLRDLNAVAREPAQDAYLSFSGGAYHVHPEVPGTILREDAVSEALHDFASSLTLTQSASGATFEVTDCDCYVPPEVTVENAGFDFEKALADDLTDMCVTVDFHGVPETLAGETLAVSRLTVRRSTRSSPPGRRHTTHMVRHTCFHLMPAAWYPLIFSRAITR